MRVETRHGASPNVVISLRWETIEIGGVKAPLSLRPNRRLADTTISDRTVLGRRRVDIELPPAGDTAHGFYYFPGREVVVDTGFRTEWTTVR